MRHCLLILIGASLLHTSAVHAQEPSGPNPVDQSLAQQGEPARKLTIEELRQFGQEVYQLANQRDNIYVYEQISGELENTARSFAGSEIEFVASVKRVTRNEVLVNLR